MRPTLVYVLAATLPALSVLAQRHHHGGSGFFNSGGSDVPNTFITMTSAAASTTSDTGFSSAASPITASSSDAASSLTSSSSSSSAAAAAAAPATASSSVSSSGSIDTSLIPPFGITPGIKATDGTANCVGDKGKDIPCDCPPDPATFASAVETFVAAGQPFPTSDSVTDQLTRLETCIVTLQNFRGGAGSGVGCPAVSTTWNELRTQISAEK